MKVLLTLAVLLGFVFALQAKAQSGGISGDYIEARSGEVYTCGCLYSGQMVTTGKDAVLVWRITAGDYQGTPLAGIKVAAVVVGEKHLGLTETPRRSVLYIDGNASVAQRDVVVSVWSHAYAPALGTIESIHKASISFEQEGDAFTLRIPGLLQVNVRKVRLPEDAHPGSALWYQPFVSLSQSSLVTMLDYEYAGLDFQRQWRDLMPSISGFMGRFALPSSF